MKILKRIMAAAMVLSMGVAVPVMASNTDNTKDYTIGDIWWDESDRLFMGRWDEPEDTTSYKVQLYKGSSTKVGSTQSTSAERMNFTSLITGKGSGSYYFTVYSQKGGKDTLVKSEVLVVDSDMIREAKERNQSSGNKTSSGGPGVSSFTSNVQSGTTSTTTGGPATSVSTADIQAGNLPGNTLASPGLNLASNGIWWYKNTDGTYIANDWIFYDNKWYFFDAQGYMYTGWVQWKGLWYYLGKTDGVMLTNTTTPDGYYVNADGVWVQ